MIRAKSSPGQRAGRQRGSQNGHRCDQHDKEQRADGFESPRLLLPVASDMRRSRHATAAPEAAIAQRWSAFLPSRTGNGRREHNDSDKEKVVSAGFKHVPFGQQSRYQ